MAKKKKRRKIKTTENEKMKENTSQNKTFTKNFKISIKANDNKI